MKGNRESVISALGEECPSNARREIVDSKKLLAYCLSKPGAFEDYPFGPDPIVIKVRSKLCALLSRQNGLDILSLKCNPEYSQFLRNQYSGSIIPGYHLNKRHWNTICLDGKVPEGEIHSLIDHSYDLVYSSLPKRLRSGEKGDAAQP